MVMKEGRKTESRDYEFEIDEEGDLEFNPRRGFKSVTQLPLAQPDFVYYFCENAANYTVNSKYQSNLNNALPALPTTNRGLGFYKLSLGNGNDTVNTVALCRGDVNSDVCDSCVNDSIVKLPQLCPNQKAAIGYYDYCFLTYSNEIILNNPRISFVYLSNHQNATDSERFNSALAPLLRQLRGYAAAAAPLAKFASGNVTGPGFTTIYVIMQCIPDLSEQQCMDCLEDIINRMAQYYNGKVGGRVLLPMCNFRYETYKFFNGSTAQVVSPPSSPPILQSSPSVPQQTPPPDQSVLPDDLLSDKDLLIVEITVFTDQSFKLGIKLITENRISDFRGYSQI
ncbi:cysteine-rich repeat secretory protein 38 [Helianthus annuus]|uniref:cysteine-rich repeat secretory protein 38 n=1 Tax=Helianthus annuus TaxID=4232 RepID=UPI000B8FAFE9|nr:cysteine-rich repeat secretory protein 38 [Helianthus annuus]